MVEKAVRNTTTKKPVRKAAPKKAASKTVTAKKTATIKASSKKAVTRKAPTPVASQQASTKLATQIRIVGIVCFLLIVAVSIAVGVSGDGQISIEGTILERKAEANPEERARIESIPAQDANPLPNGGLVPSGVPVVVPKPLPVATSTADTASSTDATASSTEPVAAQETDEAPETQDPVTAESSDEEIIEEDTSP